MNLKDMTSVTERRKAVEKVTGVTLANIGSYTLDDITASGRNCENMVGVSQVPLGIAGPLLIGRGTQAKSLYIPLATTEAALVASVNRGCKAIVQSKGASVTVKRIGATRAPVFRVTDDRKREKLLRFLGKDFPVLQKVARSTSHHLSLLSYETACTGRYVFVRFVYDTSDAMGLNMVTIATDRITSYIKENTGISCLALSGNMCTDKKPAWGNAIRGRGFAVWAEVTLPKKVLKQTLKTTAKKAYDVWLAKCMIGSAMAGSMGYNAHFANIVAALFIATGQDPAHAVEGSLGMTTAEAAGEDLYVSIYMPDVMVGTVGGGTGLATQKEALSLLGVAGGNNGKNAEELARIIGAAVLAGEISLLASLEEGSLARAHRQLARGKETV